MDELMQVLDYIAHPTNNLGPCLVSNAEGTKSIVFAVYGPYDNDIWTFEDLFFAVCSTNDAIVLSKFARYRLAAAAEQQLRKTYMTANDIKNKYMDEWLGEYKVD